MEFNQNNNQYNGNNQGFNPQQNNVGYNPGFNGGQYGANPYNTTPNTNYNNQYNQYNPYNQPAQQMYPYGLQNNQQNHFISQQKFLRHLEQKKEIKKFATIIAFAMLGFFGASLIVSLILEIFNLSDLYSESGAFSSAVGIFYSMFTVGIPFLIAKKAIGEKEDIPKVSYSAPKPSLKTVTIILLSVLGCLASMYLTGYIQGFFELFGFNFSSGEEPVVESILDIIGLFVGTAIVPPLVEEFAMRNVVMQPLRKYGNTFAIISSALIFGIFHGTPSQIPFAILCGLFLGFAVIATDSIWSGVIVHAIINGLSCTYYAILYFTDEDTADVAYGIICIAIAVIGVTAFIIYASVYKDDYKRVLSKNGLEDYTLKQKLSKFFFTPVMIIAILIFLFQAISMISFSSGI